MRNTIILSFVLLVSIFGAVLTFGGAKQLDVVAREAVKSFEEIIPAGNASFDDNGNFTLIFPNGKERFFIGKRVGVEFDLEPFLKAGLNPDKLPPDFSVKGTKLIVSIENNKFEKNSNPDAVFSEFVENNRNTIGYHSGHFGISLKVSHFEWAKDMVSNDKDLVFMLNPAMLSGLDPAKLDGWYLTKVKMMDGNRVFETERLLKFYNIK